MKKIYLIQSRALIDHSQKQDQPEQESGSEFWCFNETKKILPMLKKQIPIYQPSIELKW